MTTSQRCQLHDLVALRLATRQIDVERAIEQLRAKADRRRLGRQALDDLPCRDAGRLHGVLEMDARHFDRLLEREEQPRSSAIRR